MAKGSGRLSFNANDYWEKGHCYASVQQIGPAAGYRWRAACDLAKGAGAPTWRYRTGEAASRGGAVAGATGGVRELLLLQRSYWGDYAAWRRPRR